MKVGITPMAAHMFVMYFGMMTMITPPVAVAAFAGASLAGSDAMQTGWEAVRFGWVAYLIPFLFVAAPSLLLDGTPFAITQQSSPRFSVSGWCRLRSSDISAGHCAA